MLVIEKSANPSFLTGKTGTILNVYTKSTYRRQGMAGTKMAIEHARQMNLSLLELKATADGLPLYTDIGFAPEASKYTNIKYVF